MRGRCPVRRAGALAGPLIYTATGLNYCERSCRETRHFASFNSPRFRCWRTKRSVDAGNLSRARPRNFSAEKNSARSRPPSVSVANRLFRAENRAVFSGAKNRTSARRPKTIAVRLNRFLWARQDDISELRLSRVENVVVLKFRYSDCFWC